ncbi:hypothetical protein ACOME3_008260 [Neoechinorhynchus agilis]
MEYIPTMVSKTVVQETHKAAADNGRSILNENIICQRIFEKVLEEVSHRITMLFNNTQNQLAEQIHKLLTLIQPATPNQFASVSDCNPNNGVKMVSAQPKGKRGLSKVRDKVNKKAPRSAANDVSASRIITSDSDALMEPISIE